MELASGHVEGAQAYPELYAPRWLVVKIYPLLLRYRGGQCQGASRSVVDIQSRVAKMEAGDSSVSIDFLVRSLLALGASTKAVATVSARSCGC
jgi:hypothetical protein